VLRGSNIQTPGTEGTMGALLEYDRISNLFRPVETESKSILNISRKARITTPLSKEEQEEYFR
jgi:hypothetical protein